MNKLPTIDELLEDLLDHSVEGPWVTACGPTGYEPARDFPVCRRAVEALVKMGAAAVPRMLALLQSDCDLRALFAAEVLGRLRIRGAVPHLERLVRRQIEVSRQVNFDQFIDYTVYEAAFEALAVIDAPRAAQLLQEMATSGGTGAGWARRRLDAQPR